MIRALTAASLALMLAGCSLLPQRTPQPAVQRPPLGADVGQCLAALDTARVRYAALPDRVYAPGCQAVGAVRIDGVSGDRGAFRLSGLGPVACPLAQAFAGWARFGVDRAARQMLGSGLARIETMGSYACRPVAGRGRMSAHARAEAIDIGGFVLEDGRRISVKAGWNGASDQERAFLRTVHASACKRFGTVLGPAYNAAHNDHFHVEMGNGSFCR